MFVKRDNNKCTNKFSKIQAQKSTIQCKIKPMNDENENPPFGTNITEHNASSTRILFVNPNGLDHCIDTHRLIELLDNSKHYSY